MSFLRAHQSPSYRVEAVDTVGHWPALHLARAGIPLARGWFRQDDFPQNALLYRPLTAASYLAWLRTMAVRYVVLPDATLDYTAHGEAALLRSGRAGLRVALRARHLTIFEVRAPAADRHRAGTRADGLADGERGGPRRRRAPAPIASRSATRPIGASSPGCARPASDGMTRLTVPRAGRVTLAFSWTPERALDVIAGSPASDCRRARP